jgi:hypothetical protein
MDELAAASPARLCKLVPAALLPARHRLRMEGAAHLCKLVPAALLPARHRLRMEGAGTGWGYHT